MAFQLAVRTVEVIRRGRLARPGDDLAEAVLPRHARREAEGLSGARDVGRAMPDVTAAELPGHVRLKVLTARERCQGTADVGDPPRLAAAEIEHPAVGA